MPTYALASLGVQTFTSIVKASPSIHSTQLPCPRIMVFPGPDRWPAWSDISPTALPSSEILTTCVLASGVSGVRAISIRSPNPSRFFPFCPLRAGHCVSGFADRASSKRGWFTRKRSSGLARGGQGAVCLPFPPRRPRILSPAPIQSTGHRHSTASPAPDWRNRPIPVSISLVFRTCTPTPSDRRPRFRAMGGRRPAGALICWSRWSRASLAEPALSCCGRTSAN